MGTAGAVHRAFYQGKSAAPLIRDCGSFSAHRGNAVKPMVMMLTNIRLSPQPAAGTHWRLVAVPTVVMVTADHQALPIPGWQSRRTALVLRRSSNQISNPTSNSTSTSASTADINFG